MRLRTPILIPLLLLLTAFITLTIDYAMGNAANNDEPSFLNEKGDTIHVTATLTVQLLDPGNNTPVPNTKLYIKTFLEEHEILVGRYVEEHNAVKITDDNGIVSYTVGYDLKKNEAIRFQASHISFREGAYIVYFRYDEAEKERESSFNSVNISKTIHMSFNRDACLTDTNPEMVFKNNFY